MDPNKLRYTNTHEWVALEGDTVTVGITDFAASQLSDITYIELPKVGAVVKNGADFGKIETVKSVSDLYAPVDGEVTAVNSALVDDTSPLTAAPFGAGWLVKIKLKPGANLDHLLTAEQYAKQKESESH
jgi:glycine cleavage system H protein